MELDYRLRRVFRNTKIRSHFYKLNANGFLNIFSDTEQQIYTPPKRGEIIANCNDQAAKLLLPNTDFLLRNMNPSRPRPASIMA
jgi:hypothetical protein